MRITKQRKFVPLMVNGKPGSKSKRVIAPVKAASLSLVTIAISPGNRCRGTVLAGAIAVPCALGRGGAQIKWREGDGRSPTGLFALRRLHFRGDRLKRPRSNLAIDPIADDAWWCDDGSDRAYNRLVRRRLPPPTCAERLKRADRLYDIVIEIGFNDRPAVRNKGSGIFWHVARENFTPTAGCVATRLTDLQRILPSLGPRTRIRIGAHPFGKK